MAHPGIVYLDESSQPPRRAQRRCCNFNGIGILGCLFSILGVFTFGLASPIGLVISLLGMGRRPRFAATVGTVLGGLGTGFLLLCGWAVLAGINAVEYEDQADQTEVVMEQGVASIEQYRREHDALPEGVNGNKLLISAQLTDAWGESLRYDPLDEDAYLVRSAGPDRTFDTADDLTLR